MVRKFEWTPFRRKRWCFLFRMRLIKKYLFVILALPTLLFSTPAIGGSKTFIKEYIYQASEIDSKVSCRAIALEQIKRLLLIGGSWDLFRKRDGS
jgi:hypothetical protein